MMDSELFMKDQLWVSKTEASVLISIATLMRKIIFAVYDKAAESPQIQHSSEMKYIKHDNLKLHLYMRWDKIPLVTGSNIKICISLRKADCFGILKRWRSKNPLNISLSSCNLFFTHLLPCTYCRHMFFRIFFSGLFEFSRLENVMLGKCKKRKHPWLLT